MNSAISRGEFLEYGEHEGQLYGTRLSTIRDISGNGIVSILDVEPNALRILRTKAYSPLVVYVAPGTAVRNEVIYSETRKSKILKYFAVELIDKKILKIFFEKKSI